MKSLDKMIDQAFSDLKTECGGVRNDYFGLIYIEDEYGVPRNKAVNQIAFGGNDYGLDGFHFDRQKKNLYLFQFKYSDSHAQFKQSLERLIDAGIERIFVAPHQDSKVNQIILQLRSCMVENRAIIEQVCIHFVFTGDPIEAERSQVLDKLREDLENKKYLLDKFFNNRNVSLVVEFRSATGKVGPVIERHLTRVYSLPLTEMLIQSGPNGETMHIGFIRLIDLHVMHCDMGHRFFERNIRYGLGSSKAVNRAISRSLKQIVLDEKEEPDVFAFNHNGITLFAENIEHIDGQYQITAPRLLNGAQTVTTFREFLEKNKDNPRLTERKVTIDQIRVLCKVITQAPQEFITTVTINNNRQNPVEPWNLHANDMIQLEIQDKLRDDLGIYYERQQDAFSNISQDEMEETGITEAKAIELVKLAQAFLVSDGNIQRLSNMRAAFEDDKSYSQMFNEKRLKAESSHIVLCYKIQFRLRKLLREILEKGPNKYWFIYRARHLLWALLCQGILNDQDLDSHAENFGLKMTIPANYTAYLVQLTTSRCRPLISQLIKDDVYVEKVKDENFNFLRTNQAYKQCMDFAYKRWKWVEKKLK